MRIFGNNLPFGKILYIITGKISIYSERLDQKVHQSNIELHYKIEITRKLWNLSIHGIS